MSDRANLGIFPHLGPSVSQSHAEDVTELSGWREVERRWGCASAEMPRLWVPGPSLSSSRLLSDPLYLQGGSPRGPEAPSCFRQTLARLSPRRTPEGAPAPRLPWFWACLRDLQQVDCLLNPGAGRCGVQSAELASPLHFPGEDTVLKTGVTWPRFHSFAQNETLLVPRPVEGPPLPDLQQSLAWRPQAGGLRRQWPGWGGGGWACGRFWRKPQGPLEGTSLDFWGPFPLCPFLFPWAFGGRKEASTRGCSPVMRPKAAPGSSSARVSCPPTCTRRTHPGRHLRVFPVDFLSGLTRSIKSRVQLNRLSTREVP